MNTPNPIQEAVQAIAKRMETEVKEDATIWNGMLVWEAGDADTVHTILTEEITKTVSLAQTAERASIKKDMLIRMKEWHGTGPAMVKDYFALTEDGENK